MLVLMAELVPDARQISGWVNGNLYQQTSEVFGILPIPDDIRSNSGMQPFVPATDFSQQHSWIAKKHGTRKPVLPLHSSVEYRCFSALMQESAAFNPRSDCEPNWKEAVKIWNRIAETDGHITYKVSRMYLFAQFDVFIILQSSFQNISSHTLQRGSPI